MALDVIKSDSDRENYDKEFQELSNKFSKLISRNLMIRAPETQWQSTSLLVGCHGMMPGKHALNASNADSEYTHYMATVTSQEEQDEINRQPKGGAIGIQVWLGGSADASIEGEWRWVEASLRAMKIVV